MGEVAHRRPRRAERSAHRRRRGAAIRPGWRPTCWRRPSTASGAMGASDRRRRRAGRPRRRRGRPARRRARPPRRQRGVIARRPIAKRPSTSSTPSRRSTSSCTCRRRRALLPLVAATPAPSSSARTRRRRSPTTPPAPTTCCRPAARPASPRGCRWSHFQKRVGVVELDRAAALRWRRTSSPSPTKRVCARTRARPTLRTRVRPASMRTRRAGGAPHDRARPRSQLGLTDRRRGPRGADGAPASASSTTCSSCSPITAASTSPSRAPGDLDVDGHHTVEDIGLALGQAFARHWVTGAASSLRLLSAAHGRGAGAGRRSISAGGRTCSTTWSWRVCASARSRPT